MPYKATLSSLPWQERALEIARLHNIFSNSNSKWTRADTAKKIGFPKNTTYINIQVANHISDPHITNCQSLRQAYLELSARHSNIISNTLSNIIAPTNSICTIINTPFPQWASKYHGPKFNLIHCDFKPNHLEYLNCLLQFAPTLISSSCHLLIWTQWENFNTTIQYLKALPKFQLHAPLIWHKSNATHNQLSYEICLLISIGQRPISDSKVLSYSGNTHRHDPKPEPMLRHFFSLLIDQTTIMLDPCCYYGASCRAAQSLHAKSIIGLETNKTIAANAQTLLSSRQVLAKPTRGI